MKRLLITPVLLALSCGGAQSEAPADQATTAASADAPKAPAAPAMKLTYPETRREQVVDDYHGTKVEDPYRWLEDDNAEEVKAWVEKQNQVTFAYLDKIPAREEINKRLTQLWDYEKYGTPFKVADRYFYSKNDGLQNQSVLYWTKSLDAEPKVLIDPNTLSKDGTVALRGYAISEDGKYIAYGLAAAGSDWNQWKIRDIDSGKDLPETLDWIKFSGAAWTHDNKGFYYSRYPEPKKGDKLKGANFNQALYYHKLGTPQSKDKLIYRRPDHPKWGFGPSVSEDGRYLIVSVWKGTGEKNLVFYRDLKRRPRRGRNGVKLEELISGWNAEFSFLGNDGPVFWFKTDAPTSHCHRYPQAGQEALEGADSAVEGHLDQRRCGRQAVLRRLPGRCQHSDSHVFLRWQEPRRGPAPGHRLGRRLRRQEGPHGDLLLLHQLQHPGLGLPL
jgi:hypothetical protein